MKRAKNIKAKNILICLPFVLISVLFFEYGRRFSDVNVVLQTEESSSFLSSLEGPLLADNPQLVSYLYSNFLKPPSDLPYNITIEPILNMEMLFLLGNPFEDFLYHTFSDSESPGFFIEAGAFDGVQLSNTLWLEYVKNWTGLLIEPDETSCKVLESRHRRAWISCSCISTRKYAMKSIFEIPSTESRNMSDFWHFRSNVRSLKSRFHTFQDHIRREATFTYSNIHCFPLITYLLALNVTVVDLLSLDTQGFEKNMLFNFPFDKVRVNYMLVEYFKRGPSPKSKDEELVSYLNSTGFDLIKMFEGSGEYIFKLRN